MGDLFEGGWVRPYKAVQALWGRGRLGGFLGGEFKSPLTFSCHFFCVKTKEVRKKKIPQNKFNKKAGRGLPAFYTHKS